MARRSQRLSSGTGTTSSHKRTASATEIATNTKRNKSGTKETPTKSQYFERHDDSETGDTHNGLIDAESSDSSLGGEDASEFGSDEVQESASDSDEDDEYASEDEAPKRKKPTPRKSETTTASIRTKGKELWRPGVSAGLGPGKQVIIKKPKARPAGKTAYGDETIHPNTLLFLGELKQNNDREWLKMHDPDFRQAEKDWHSFVDKLTEKLTDIDDTVPELPVKDVIFRIYRDVRFSKDPTPYKPHFSAAWSRTGRKGPYAHYYVQISPNNASFVGGGLWHPEAAPTAAMRRDIDRRAHRIKAVLMDDRMRKEFFDGVVKNESKVVKAFAKRNAENALKTKPKGYDADHADIELLKLRNYTVGRKLTEQEVLGGKVMERVCELLASMKPFITYINSVVMPDEPEESSESGSEDSSESEEEQEGDAGDE